jgi:hypothetical protein
MEAVSKAGVHLLVSTCTGNLLPFNENGSGDMPVMAEWKVPDRSLNERTELLSLSNLGSSSR